MTLKEIDENIHYMECFDKGFRYGMAFMLILFLIALLLAKFVW